MKREINEPPTGSTYLNDNCSVKSKDKKFFIAYPYHKHYREIIGKIFRIRKYNKRLNKIGMLKRHTKKYCDNMSRKIKSWVIADLIKFINKKLKEKRFYIINKEVSYNINLDFNKTLLLNNTVEDILSNYISKKTKIEEPKHNINLIREIKVQNNEYQDIKNILGLNFFVCIQHYIGEIKIDSLEGFKCDKMRLSSESEYFDKFIYFVKNMDKYYSDIKFRKKRREEMK